MQVEKAMQSMCIWRSGLEALNYWSSASDDKESHRVTGMNQGREENKKRSRLRLKLGENLTTQGRAEAEGPAEEELTQETDEGKLEEKQEAQLRECEVMEFQGRKGISRKGQSMVLEAEEKSRKKRLKTVCWVLQPQEDFSDLSKTGLEEWQVDSEKKKKGGRKDSERGSLFKEG